MTISSKNYIGLILGILIAMIITGGYAAETAAESLAPASGSKPVWLTELSLGARESYDNNLLGVSGSGMSKRYSWVTTLSPKIRINLLPFLENQRTLQELSFGYQPDFATYFQDPEESNTAHRISGTIKGKSGNCSFTLDNSFLYVNGSRVAPTYAAPDNARSAFATGFPRERRKQYQDRMKIALQWDWDKFFIRPTGSLLLYELLTEMRTASGYQNYADRYDINGGADFGRRISAQLSFFLGYRYGHQYHEQVVNSTFNATNDYHRVLAGLEGKPFKWLTLSLSFGPDFRTYGESAPVDDKNQVNFYGESALTAEISEKDTMTFRYKGTRWVSSTGQIPSFNGSFDLNYRRRFHDKLSWDLGGRLDTADYTSGNLTTGSAPSLRNDWMYVFSTGLIYDITDHIGFNMGVTANLGRNQQNGIKNADYREFDQYVTLIGISGKF